MDHEFFRHGLLPEAGPLQPPERPQLSIVRAPEPRPLTPAEKLQAVRKMAHHAKYRDAVLEALPESDTYDLILAGIVMGFDQTACDAAREAIVSYLERVAEKNEDSLENYL
jgi:hypothetical protein